MKSKKTPMIRVGRTSEALTLQVSGPSRMKVDLTVPAGTGLGWIGGRGWVVDDLLWLAHDPAYGQNSITYHDADHYGIDVPADKVVDIEEE